MDGLLSFLCLLCALVTPGHSLSCISCMGLDSCTGPSETCMPNYSCGVAYRETTEGGVINKGYIQSCVPTSKCNKVGSISYTGGTMKMGISCCNTDNCTATLPQLPATSSQANGLVCPSCRSQVLCDQQANIQCTGSEQTCVFQPSSSGTVMGCATSTLCDVGDYSYGSGSNSVVIQFLCFPATSSTATGTSCVVCQASDSITCTSSLSVIPPNSKCASAYVITTTNGVKSYQVIRSWSPVSKCNIAGSMTVGGTKLSMGISCCDGDGCTPSIPDSTSTSTVSNGVQCKTCASSSSGSCETATTMTCTGQENLCMTYAQTTTTGSISSTSSVRGCGTKSLCDAQNPSITMNYKTVVNNFICENYPSNGGNVITAPSTGGVAFLLFSTLTAMLILHQFNRDA
ncbi:urokinase plasminogen activator surface receptor-like [Rana temporaria]|uniref:urokinase plasminogen activator surface receptor-like n=1 Tax=Rana temporaria TaxID=8407 RepID=UPI001AAD6B86|nr:urokinase plasminogen activator surface receptor-like [Rana temporaria]